MSRYIGEILKTVEISKFEFKIQKIQILNSRTPGHEKFKNYKISINE
jgi:hypothetical protein